MQGLLSLNNHILMLTFIIYVGLGIFIFFWNKKNQSNRSFAAFLFCVALWTLSFYIFQNVTTPDWVLMARRFTPVGSSLLAGYFLYFSLIFPSEKQKIAKWLQMVVLLPGWVFAIISIFSGLMIKAVVVEGLIPFTVKPIFGPVYPLFTVYFIIYFFAGIAVLIWKYRQAVDKAKLQLAYVLSGALISGILGVIVSLILPLLGMSFLFVSGPPFTLVLAGFVTYAIIKHELLNITDFVAWGVSILAALIVLVGSISIIASGNTTLLLRFYIMAAMFYLGTLVLIRNPWNPVNYSFFGLTVGIVAWSVSILRYWTSGTTEQALFWAILANASAAFIPAFFLHFTTTFPKEKKPAPLFMKLLWGAVPVFFSVAALLRFVVRDVSLSPRGYDVVPGPLFIFYMLYFLLYFIIGFSSLIKKHHIYTGAIKMQIRYVFLGSLLASFFSLITNLVMPLFGNSSLTGLGPYFIFIFIACTAYAIVRHRLMSIAIVIQRGTAYAIATGLILIIYASTVLLSELFFRRITGYSSVYIIAFATIVIAVIYQPLVRSFQDITARFFFRGRYDYQKTLQKVSQEIASILRLEEISALIVNVFVKVVGVKEISFLLYDPRKDKFKSASPPSVPGSEKYIKIEIEATNPTIELLKANREILVSYELERDLPVSPRSAKLVHKQAVLKKALEEMSRLELVVWVPIISKDELVGCITVGDKESGDVFTTEDLALFSVLAAQIAVALDNARLYEEVLNMKNYNEDVLQSMSSGVLTTDLRGHIITFNKTAERITGFLPEQVIGKTCEEVCGAGGVISTLVEKALRGRSNLRIEADISNPHKGFVPVAVSATLLRDSGGKKMGVLLTLDDLTILKELEDKVRQSDKLAALGTMAAGMAHEIKNPLSSMKVLSQLMPLKFEDHEFRGKFQEIMPKEISRIDRIVENLLGFARASAPKFEKVKIELILEENLDYFSNQLESAKIELVKKFEEVPEIIADAAQLSQVFSNFILNAIQAMQGGGSLTIEMGKGKISEGELQDVVISFTDTGCGMSKEQLNKLFEPFFTTKYGGTGLGLTITHSIIDGHGGTVSVKSAPGKGTTFKVVFPISQ
ncbi:MAG: PAS domain S-box protein [Candidatus Margulisbacteria bacterium]|nr:PAS domain S-box protein [Candidatus Margulisiibacteriota bacterium]MBU1021192.1 PAS domain S-box protein [Candidatus Margulisiibacteriota bacterium]MBU1729798.1 PAS domain S-box protein [Candidatus Margulisiibacteriota bacterium]MBU1955299.1 PAS domain S-box protein [Candidatus Margulisiibacteriota bacterium]